MLNTYMDRFTRIGFEIEEFGQDSYAVRAVPDNLFSIAKKELLKIKGVGGKVADCILLFSMGRYELFPKDVWIKRILNQVYGVEEKETDSFVTEKYGNYAGFAQQYMYYYYRENDIEK